MTQTNSAWKQRLTDMENKLAAARGDRERRSMDWESGVSRCQLLHAERTDRSCCRAQGTALNSRVSMSLNGKGWVCVYTHT